MAEDCRTPLGPYRDVASEGTLLRLFRYLGASEDAMQEAERDLRRWSRGGIHIDMPEDRLSLLGVNAGRRAVFRGTGRIPQFAHDWRSYTST